MTRQRGPDGRFIATKQAITAAASVLPQRAIDNLPRAPQGWQERAWALWRILGVLHFPTTFKAKQVGRLRWNVTVNGTELEPEQAEAALSAVVRPLTIREASRRIALNFEIAGEVFHARAGDAWKVYAATAPKLKEKLKAADIVVHGINPDPVDPDIADSAVRAALATAEQIRLMCALSRSQDRNRLAQRGILLVPKEGKFPEGDDFQANLEESMTAPIADEYAPSAVVPLKVEFPAEYIEKWRHLLIESPYDDKLMDRIDKAITQLALELDMPPEMLLGNMDSNHWNAWLSSEENYAAHVEPLGALTAEVYAEAMMEAVDGAVEIVVTPDPTDLLARRASVSDAFEAVRVGAVGLAYVREVIGATDEDAPTEADIALILALLGHAQTEPEEPGIEQQPAAPTQPESSPNGNGRPVAAAVDEPDADLDEMGDRLADIDQHLLIRLAGAADMVAAQVRAIIDASDVGAQEAVASEVHRLGTTWGRMVEQGRKALGAHGIDASGEEWQTAQERSVEVLEDGVTAWLIETLERTDSEMGEVPTDLLRQVLAVAGGSEVPVLAALTKPRGILPQPTPADPMGFAVGLLSGRELERQGIRFTQWRFRYGTALRERPFEFHKDQDGRFADADGVVAGWWPGDHRGCLCQLAPVYRRASVPTEVT